MLSRSRNTTIRMTASVQNDHARRAANRALTDISPSAAHYAPSKDAPQYSDRCSALLGPGQPVRESKRSAACGQKEQMAVPGQDNKRAAPPPPDLTTSRAPAIG